MYFVYRFLPLFTGVNVYNKMVGAMFHVFAYRFVCEKMKLSHLTSPEMEKPSK